MEIKQLKNGQQIKFLDIDSEMHMLFRKYPESIFEIMEVRDCPIQLDSSKISREYLFSTIDENSQMAWIVDKRLEKFKHLIQII